MQPSCHAQKEARPSAQLDDASSPSVYAQRAPTSKTSSTSCSSALKTSLMGSETRECGTSRRFRQADRPYGEGGAAGANTGYLGKLGSIGDVIHRQPGECVDKREPNTEADRHHGAIRANPRSQADSRTRAHRGSRSCAWSSPCLVTPRVAVASRATSHPVLPARPLSRSAVL